MYICRCGVQFEKQSSYIGHTGRCTAVQEYNNSVLTKEFLYDRYIEKQMSIPDIRKETGAALKTIHNRLIRLGINRSTKESNNLEVTREKIRKGNIEKYGSPHNFCKDHPSRKKWEKRLYEEEGITNVFQREEVKEKIKNTLLEKYGVEYPSQIDTSRGCKSYSKLHKEVVKELKEKGLEFYIEKKIPGKRKFYWAFDIFFEPDLLIEVNGDYWHGNPSIYRESDIILKGSAYEITVSHKWKLDREKRETAEEQGFVVLTIWESDWKEDRNKQLEVILNAIQDCKDRENSKARQV